MLAPSIIIAKKETVFTNGLWIFLLAHHKSFLFTSHITSLAFYSHRISDIGFVSELFFFYFSHKNICCEYSKYHLSEMVLLSTQNICFKRAIRKQSKFSLEILALMKLCDMRISLFVLAVERRASDPAARLHDN